MVKVLILLSVILLVACTGNNGNSESSPQEGGKLDGLNDGQPAQLEISTCKLGQVLVFTGEACSYPGRDVILWINSAGLLCLENNCVSEHTHRRRWLGTNIDPDFRIGDPLKGVEVIRDSGGYRITWLHP